MTANALPQWSDGLLHNFSIRPRLVDFAALILVLVGAVVVETPDRAGAVLGGTSGWLLWSAGMTILSAWIILLIGGRPISALLIAGAIAAASGAFLFYSPRTGALAVAVLAVSALVMDGGLQLALALKLRPAGVWRWLFASALASVVAAAVLLSGWTSPDAAVRWGPLFGAALISSGLALLVFRRTSQPANA